MTLQIIAKEYYLKKFKTGQKIKKLLIYLMSLALKEMICPCKKFRIEGSVSLDRRKKAFKKLKVPL